MELALTTLVGSRPPLGGIATIHQDALRDKFTDQIRDIYPLADPITDQLSLSVNMLQIGQCLKESLHTFLEENPDSES